MLFNSIEFLIFLPAVFLLYWFVFNRSLKWQNFFVVFVSYIFYGWWDWNFLLLIALTSFCSWLSGVWMGDRDGCPSSIRGLRGHRLFVMVANIVLNFAILGYFKYYNFFVESFVHAFHSIGMTVHPQALKIILPVGISFYTFQALSYSIDVYRGHIKPTRDPVIFFAYVSYFPQLVAGPIERATNLLPQFQSPRSFSYPEAVDGCRQMLWGFFKKMVVADNCAVAADKLLNGSGNLSGIALWVGMFCFSIQIYGDFSGYSDIAIGCSKLFGVKIMRNFAYPYFSRDIAEFWRKWHISLTTWFRDYLYIPLGGSYCSVPKQVRNIFVIFLVSGFWHGANWTFIAWGLLHACYFLPLLMLNRNRKYTGVVAENQNLPTWTEFVQMSVTFGLVLLAWTFFRAPDMAHAFSWLASMATFKGGLAPLFDGTLRLTGLRLILFWVAGMVACEWVNRRGLHGLANMPQQKVLRWSIYLLLFFIVLIFKASRQAFIYFQF